MLSVYVWVRVVAGTALTVLAIILWLRWRRQRPRCVALVCRDGRRLCHVCVARGGPGTDPSARPRPVE